MASAKVAMTRDSAGASVRHPTRATGRLAPAVLRAQLDVLAAEERRVRVIVPPAAPPLSIDEASFQRLITDLAEWCGWHWTFNADSRRTQAGVPDLLLIREQRLVWREIKAERGKLRPAQLAFGQRLLRAGQDWGVWRPSHWATEIVPTLTAEE